ncbi:hypothetical protein KRP22_007697 [Phytophthora ramorum]|uniref:uncharacterized protein n=1 Tax=Phytophthora ramorum TaxID=164328 RepID=UPI0030AAE83D|nr:hypothetical protein KRP23_14448 [Phytophthora ramorum]KAH7506328.1 hypothetical protein KRP22_4291 [Phytophthora ramorum]
MKILKSLFRKAPRERSNQAPTATTEVLPPMDLARTTRPIRSGGNGNKKPKLSNLTLVMMLSDIRELQDTLG